MIKYTKRRSIWIFWVCRWQWTINKTWREVSKQLKKSWSKGITIAYILFPCLLKKGFSAFLCVTHLWKESHNLLTTLLITLFKLNLWATKAREDNFSNVIILLNVWALVPEVTSAFFGPTFTDHYASNLFLFGLFYFIHVT